MPIPAFNLCGTPQLTTRSLSPLGPTPQFTLLSYMLSWLSWVCSWCQTWICPVAVGLSVGVGDKTVGQMDDQSSQCPFLLIAHYCATDSCQNSSSAEMYTKANVNQEGYSFVWGRNPDASSILPTCFTDSWIYRPTRQKSCQLHCNKRII